MGIYFLFIIGMSSIILNYVIYVFVSQIFVYCINNLLIILNYKFVLKVISKVTKMGIYFLFIIGIHFHYCELSYLCFCFANICRFY